MAEEVQDAARTLPRSMLWSVNINGLMGWLTAITLCYCIGDLSTVLDTPTGYPFIQVFYNSTQSLPATNFMTIIVLFMATFSCVTIMASASRQIFAFARDQALPFSGWISKVHPTLGVPVNSVIICVCISSALSFINIASVVAYNNIVSLGSAALMVSYIVCIACFLWRRNSSEPAQLNKFSMGKYGNLVNIIAIVFLSIVFIVAFFPPVPRPWLTWDTMNWSSVIFSTVLVWSIAYYYIWGRYIYEGPVKNVQKMEMIHEAEGHRYV